MKKLIPLLALLLLLVPLVSAYYYPGSEFQDQYYYVIFDEEAEAATIAMITMNNYEDITDLELEIPGQNIRIIGIYQEYYEYDDDEDYYWRYDVKYQEIDYTTNELSESVVLNFDIPIQDQDQLKLYIYYKTESYATKHGDVYKFNFETIMGEYDTNYVRVAVDVTDDLYLEGGAAGIEYRDNILAGTAKMESVASYVPYTDTGFVKTTNALDPHESFHVTGKYANSWFALNWWKVVVGILIMGAVLVGAVYGIKKGIKNKKTKLSVLLGAACGAILGFLWLGSGYLLVHLRDLIGYQYDNTFAIFVVLLTILLSFLLLAIPPILMGIKYGLKQGIWCVISLVVALTILMIVGMIVFVLVFNTPEMFYRGLAEPAIMTAEAIAI